MNNISNILDLDKPKGKYTEWKQPISKGQILHDVI